MKRYAFVTAIVILIASHPLTAQQPSPPKPPEKQDQYELKQYFFVMLSKGQNRNQDSATAAKIQKGHLENINRLAADGKILVAGPFGDEGNWRGIFIFDCKTRDEVETHLKSDPAISSGRLSYEVHPWWTVKNCVFK